MSATDVPQSPVKGPREAVRGAPQPSTGPLLLWLAVQLIAILVAVLRVPLAAAYPEPAERLVPQLLLCVQVIALALLFPTLLRHWQRAVQVVATAVPFQLAAGYLGGLSPREMLLAQAVVLTWAVALTAWRACLPSPRGQMLGVCFAVALTLGGGILRYLRLEFGSQPPPTGGFETASPLLTTLAAVEGSAARGGWVLLLTILLTGLAALGVRQFGRKWHTHATTAGILADTGDRAAR